MPYRTAPLHVAEPVTSMHGSYVPTKHPTYLEHESKWKMSKAAYNGGTKWSQDISRYRFSTTGLEVGSGRVNVEPDWRELNYLWPHPREKPEQYQRRLRSAVYPNFVKPIVDMIASTIVNSVRKLELPPQLEAMTSQMDMSGNDIAAFRRQVMIEALCLGQCYLLPEIPPGPAQPSLYHERQAGVRPYVNIVSSLDLIDWSWDNETQTFEWAEVHVARPIRRAPHDNTTTIHVPYVTVLYMPGQWQEFHDGQLMDEGPSPDFVPLLPVIINRPTDEAEPIGESPISDVVEAAELVYNKKSWLTDQEASQCFNQCFIASTDRLDSEMDRQLGTQTYISGGESMQWIAPDTAPMSHLIASMREDYQAAKATMGVETISEQSQEARSGIAMQMSRENLDAVLSGYSRPFEAAERTMWRTCATLASADPEAVVLEWSHDFSALAAASRFEQIITAIKDGGFEGRALGELQKQLFQATLPDLDEEVMAEVMDDIDAATAAALEAPPPPAFGQPIQSDEETAPFGKPKDEEAPEDKEPPPFKPPQGKPEDKRD